MQTPEHWKVIFQRTLGMRVSLAHKPGQESGQMTVQYKTLDELDELCRLLSST